MSFPKYEAYKDSGVEWLGEVHEHWNISFLKNYISTINGFGLIFVASSA
jgi:type I restriction enzyme, S subunit